MLTEYLFLVPAPESTEVQALLGELKGGLETQVSAQFGNDALGRQRCTLQVTGPSREEVAALRQALLSACRERGWKAVVV